MKNSEKRLVPAAKKVAETIASSPVSKGKPLPPVSSQVSLDVGEVAEMLCEHSENKETGKLLAASALANSAAQGIADTANAVITPEVEIIRHQLDSSADMSRRIIESDENIEILSSKVELINQNAKANTDNTAALIEAQGKWSTLKVGACCIVMVAAIFCAVPLYKATHHGFFFRLFH